MTAKTVPFTKSQIEKIIAKYPTPFHIYDEKGILENARKLYKAFSWVNKFKNYFAVKALPNPQIIKLLQQEGMGVDCSSLTELILAEKVGFKGEEIMFSSNETHFSEFQKAKEVGAIINLDDISHLPYLEKHVGLPDLLCFRYNPGPERQGNRFIGNPKEAKFGMTKKQLFEGYKIARDKGVKRFGLHTMVVSNELDPQAHITTAGMLFDLIVEIAKKLHIRFEFINLGGGFGIPYKPEQKAIDYDFVSKEIKKLYSKKIIASKLDPLKIIMENGRLITGPYGFLVTTVLHKKEIYKNYIGVDACMANLMRPGMYGAYHHETVLGKEKSPKNHIYDVVGSLCENNDKFAIDRKLPKVDIDDIIVIHDTGAHGYSMGFNYNGKLRSAELLLKQEGSVKLIRRAETIDDYLATVDFSFLNHSS